MVNERTFYKMSKPKNGISASKKDAEEREENHPDRRLTTSGILCRKIYPWVADSAERTEIQHLREVERERWNFDFLTETPLPGRYQWIRTDCSNGHSHKDTATSRSTIKNGQAKSRNSPYCRESRPSEQPEEPRRRSRLTRSCDRPSLNGPLRRSERNAQLYKTRTTV